MTDRPLLLPAPVRALLDVALVGELTVVDGGGRPITYPLIPMSDGTLVYLTSSVLFSRKLRHIKANPRVCLSLTDPVAVPAQPMHLRNPRRSMPSRLVSLTMRSSFIVGTVVGVRRLT